MVFLFLFLICDVAKVINIQNYLAKFGYVPNMILFYKKTGSFYNLYYLLELIIKNW
jgi:hypothetical protein